ncbi:hypothetical protein BKH43_04610 [Helicobacter sp. 13S00401-1]|uniref:hypothetical protein n=1 Tax=Helicobacter sp. 13S00401-1 TaxID=1905758 RepID=UPI000BA68174|nr:hypothetical protein [Helicobacter sp. 13S00401-1]PAF50377.1 hypothetical protein BKH43_04610 [Helicobacter sp. 13S00401-1]
MRILHPKKDTSFQMYAKPVDKSKLKGKVLKNYEDLKARMGEVLSFDSYEDFKKDILDLLETPEVKGVFDRLKDK